MCSLFFFNIAYCNLANALKEKGQVQASYIELFHFIRV